MVIVSFCVVAVLIFALGGGIALYEGVEALLHPPHEVNHEHIVSRVHVRAHKFPRSGASGQRVAHRWRILPGNGVCAGRV